MTNFTQLSADYKRIEQAIRFLDENALLQPDLTEVAAHVGLSECHFQRLFTRWAGISPKRSLQYLTKENAKALLSRTSVLSAAYEPDSPARVVGTTCSFTAKPSRLVSTGRKVPAWISSTASTPPHSANTC